MKDAPSNMMKFMKKVTKETMKEAAEKNETEQDNSIKEELKKEVTSKQNCQKVKKGKAKAKKQRKAKVPTHLSSDEKNKKMTKRIPKIRERSHKSEIHL